MTTTTTSQTTTDDRFPDCEIRWNGGSMLHFYCGGTETDVRTIYYEQRPNSENLRTKESFYRIEAEEWFDDLAAEEEQEATV